MTIIITDDATAIVPPRSAARATRRLALFALVTGGGLGAGSLLGRSRLLDRPTKPPAPLTPARNGERIALGTPQPDAPTKGPAGAPVSLVLFADLECPMCRAHAATLDRALAEYGGRVKLIYRHYPIAPPGELVARATEAAREQGKFWEMYQRLCAGEGGKKRGALMREARGLGLDPDRFTRALDGAQARARVSEDTEAARRLGIEGTPTTFVNGRLLVGAEGFEALEKLIDAELREGRRSG